MNELLVKFKPATSRNYPVLVGSGISKSLYKLLPALKQASKLVIVSDFYVGKKYGTRLLTQLKKERDVLLIMIPEGERSKTQKFKTYVEHQMLKQGCDRNAIILALGGGVVGDLAGFVAATYMRGIPYIQIPTTLLAMVDSSLGGKTGIDTPQGKNLIGAFWQPRAVIVDTDFLKSLPQKQLINGLVEAVKMFMTSDAESFAYVEQNLNKILNRDEKALEYVIQNAVKIKTSIISRDERESGERMVLNFGHTIGHALEKLSNYKIMHGEAVAQGILVEARISRSLGLLLASDYDRIKSIFSKLGITSDGMSGWKTGDIIKQTQTDKKSKQGQARYALLKKIGQVHKKNTEHAHTVSDKIVKKSLRI